MYFVTNRFFKEKAKSPQSLAKGKKRTVRFDLKNNLVSNQIYFCKKEGEKLYEIGSSAFFNEIKESGYSDVLLYVHGFNNFPKKHIFPRTERLQKMYDAHLQTKKVLVIPLIWPCNSKFGMLRDYVDDQMNADASAFAMVRAFEKFIAHSQKNKECSMRLNVLAHSMGNRVLRETLIKLKYEVFPKVFPQVFRNIFLVAADVVNETLHRGESGSVLSEACRNCVVYYASDDLALNGSKIINLKSKVVSRRLGHTGVEDMQRVSPNVYNIDCDDFNNLYDFPKGHSYFLDDDEEKAGKLFLHTVHAIESGRVHFYKENALTL